MKNMSWINSQIAVSGFFTDKDVPTLKRQGINAVIDVRSERADNEKLLNKNGIDYLKVDVKDTFTPSFEQLGTIMGFIGPLLRKGSKVLIHCQNGAGRSTLVAVAVLARGGMKIPEAVKLVKHKHPNTGFTENQVLFLNNELADFLKS